MKYSLFNNIVPVSDNLSAIYNALNDMTVFVKKKALKDIDSLTLDSRLFNCLYENGFIINSDVEEFDNYVKYVNLIEDDNKSFHILLNPTIDCNFHCWYCYEKHQKSQMSEDVIGRVKRLISSILKERNTLQLSFFGGEPMLFFKQVIAPLLEYTNAEAKKYGRRYFTNMTTNGYLFNPERIAFLRRYNFNGAQITLDGNKEQHNKIRFPKEGIGSYDRIVANIKELVKNEIPITVRINCSKDNIENITDIVNSFSDLTEKEKSYLNVDLQLVWQEKNREELIGKLDNIAASFDECKIPASKMCFKDFCYADKRNSCLINYNGDVYKCTAVDFENTQRDGYLNEKGEIVWENDSMEKRMASKFKNKLCHSCRILPLCHGGCSKQTLNHESEYCLYASDEDKDKVVLDRIEYNIIHNQKKYIKL